MGKSVNDGFKMTMITCDRIISKDIGQLSLIIYNRNCNLSPMMLALSPDLSPSEQYRLILNLISLFLISTFTKGRAHYDR